MKKDLIYSESLWWLLVPSLGMMSLACLVVAIGYFTTPKTGDALKKRVIEVQVELTGTLEAKEDTVAVVVRRPNATPLSGAEVKAIGNAVKQAFGDAVLVICLGPNEGVETLSETEMNARGWVRGAVSPRSEMRRTH